MTTASIFVCPSKSMIVCPPTVLAYLLVTKRSQGCLRRNNMGHKTIKVMLYSCCCLFLGGGWNDNVRQWQDKDSQANAETRQDKAMKSQVPVRPCLVITRFWPQFRSRFCHVGKGINIGTDLIKKSDNDCLDIRNEFIHARIRQIGCFGQYLGSQKQAPKQPKNTLSLAIVRSNYQYHNWNEFFFDKCDQIDQFSQDK